MLFAVSGLEGKLALVLFADVSSAYYCSVRELAARRDGVTTLPSTELEGLASSLACDSALRRSGTSRWLEAVTAEFHRGSWFTLCGDATAVETHKGSRPGSSLADLVYSAGARGVAATDDRLTLKRPST